MSKISTALRAAALGPAPKQWPASRAMSWWIPDENAFHEAKNWLVGSEWGDFYESDQRTRRMLFLFIAEAVA